MNRKPVSKGRVPRREPWARLTKRLDELAERDGWASNREKIELLGRAIFGDLWDARPASDRERGIPALQPD